MPDMFQDVADFHEKFDQGYNGPPRQLDWAEKYFRQGFLQEEVSEHLLAIETENPAEQLDALADICFVAIGTAYKMGLDFNEAWRRVVAANMAKQAVTSGGKFKISKPEGWVAPDHTDLVKGITT